jgi:glycosyltransferase involved in cell wall biosynthesis
LGDGKLRERVGLLRLVVSCRRFARALSRYVPIAPRGNRTVAMISAFPPGHYGTFSRLTRWIPHLSKRGWHVDLYCPVTDDQFAAYGRGNIDDDLRFFRAYLDSRKRDLIAAANADVVVLHRGVLPFGPWGRPTFERELARINPRLVFDYYDSIWEQRKIIAAAAESRLARWLNPPDLVEEQIRCAAAVTPATEYLADFARPHNDRVHVLPMALAPDEYEVVTHGRRDRVVLGWTGGRGNLKRLLAIAPALRAAAARVKFALRVVAPEAIEIPGVDVECRTHPWSPESERRDLAGFDVGLLPLFDDAEDRGKFPLKLLQYAAAGLPIVATPVAIDRERFQSGESVLFARDEAEWVEAIVAVVRDASLRARVGGAARRVLEGAYSFEAHADAYSKLLESVAGAGR